MERSTIFHGKTHYKWWFSIVMLVYQRVYGYITYISGWWLTYPSGKYEFVSWDDEIPNWLEKYNSCSKPPTSKSTILDAPFFQKPANDYRNWPISRTDNSWLQKTRRTAPTSWNQHLQKQHPNGCINVLYSMKSYSAAWKPQKQSPCFPSPIGSMVLVYMLTFGVYWW